MLTDDQRKAIEAQAASQLRQQWGHVNPRALGDVVAEIRTRMAEGTWGQQSFAEQIDSAARLAYAHAVYTRDEAAAERADRDLEPGA